MPPENELDASRHQISRSAPVAAWCCALICWLTVLAVVVATELVPRHWPGTPRIVVVSWGALGAWAVFLAAALILRREYLTRGRADLAPLMMRSVLCALPLLVAMPAVELLTHNRVLALTIGAPGALCAAEVLRRARLRERADRLCLRGLSALMYAGTLWMVVTILRKAGLWQRLVAAALVAMPGQPDRPSERVVPSPQCNPSAVTWRTPHSPNQPQAGDVWICPKDGKAMVFVPAGQFVMGSARGDSEGVFDQRPQRRVDLDALWIDKTEVTVAEYRKFCQATGRQMPQAPDRGWKDDHPVVNVAWEDAAAYAKWAGKRLPTEAEWEKAARGTDGRKYPWGDGEPDAGGNWRCNLGGEQDGFKKAAPVGSLPLGASPYGCADMAGNVWEWCADWYHYDYYASAPTRNPKGSASGRYRVLRGGGYLSPSRQVRCATRFSLYPWCRMTCGGFRCAKTP